MHLRRAMNNGVMSVCDSAGFLDRHQVAIYLSAFVGGGALGLLVPSISEPAEYLVTPVLGALLFVTFLQVPIAELPASLRHGRFLAAVLLTNFVVVPLVVAALRPLMPASDPIRLGIMLVLLCPCIDYVIVFSGLAGARSDRLLAATPLLLLTQFLLLPVYLRILGGDSIAAIDPMPFLRAFLALIALPLVAAWAVQSWVRRNPERGETVGRAEIVMVPLMAGVLALVAASQIRRLDADLRPFGGALACYVVFLLVMPVLGTMVGRLFQLDARSIRAVAFSGSTRNSLVVLPLALALPAGAGIAAAAVVAQTAVELIGMMILLRVIPRVIPVT